MEVENYNKNKRSIKSIRSIIITAVVSCLLTGIGVLTVCKIKSAEDGAVSQKKSVSYTDMFKNKGNAHSTETLNVNEDNPLNHLKLLKEDMEAFRALMEEVMKESFVTET